MRLRRSCEHGFYVQHGGYDDDGRIWEPCPGGEFLTDADLEAAAKALRDWDDAAEGYLDYYRNGVKAVLAALEPQTSQIGKPV